MPCVSVCMATYNGSDYIHEQLATILPDLPSDSEIIIVDDCSDDTTVEIVMGFSDDRIRLVVNDTNIGVNRNFEKAIGLCSGDYIFLADQDDVWKHGRVSRMIDVAAGSNAMLLSSAFEFIDGDGNYVKKGFLFLDEDDSRRPLKNILGIFSGNANYYGCAMLFKKELLDYCLPFPKWTESHDLWIAICANVLKSNVHTQYSSLYRRLHGHNFSVVDRPLLTKLRSRLIFVFHILVILKRVFLKKVGKDYAQAL